MTDPDWQARASKAERELEAGAADMKLAADSVEMLIKDRDALRRDAERMRGELEEAINQGSHNLDLRDALGVQFDALRDKLAIAVGALEAICQADALVHSNASCETARRALEQINEKEKAAD